jgi:hypothetical protein
VKNNYKGSPLFNDIADVKLRTWNRCAIMFNLMADRGQTAAQAYAAALGEEGQKQVLGMFDCIRKFGYEAVRKQIKVEAALEA